MQRLNKNAAELAVTARLHGGTDITGFSLLGHAWELAEASHVGCASHSSASLYPRRPPLCPGVDLPRRRLDNRLYFGPHVHFAPEIDEVSQMLLFDPQTSGGLLLAVPLEKLAPLLDDAARAGQVFWEVGEAVLGEGIEVVP